MNTSAAPAGAGVIGEADEPGVLPPATFPQASGLKAGACHTEWPALHSRCERPDCFPSTPARKEVSSELAPKELLRARSTHLGRAVNPLEKAATVAISRADRR